MRPFLRAYFTISLLLTGRTLVVRLPGANATASDCLTKDEVQHLIQAEREILIKQLDHLVGSFHHPVKSCKDLPDGYLTGYYWITNSTGSANQVYCGMVKSCDCDGCAKRWTRVAHLDMTNAHHQCPTGLSLRASPKRTCEKISTTTGCTSVIFPTHGQQYSRVCGKIIAYQQSHPSAFRPYIQRKDLTLNDSYVDGVSLTCGPGLLRQHIWTFAAAYSDKTMACSCSAEGVVPPYVDRDFFCETGSRTGEEIEDFFREDPLWDGEGCSSQSDCCRYNDPPWFNRQLSRPTTDDVEMRLCLNQHKEYGNVLIQMIDIFIQ